MAAAKILIVDDDVELLSELQEVLSVRGYDPVVINDGAAALNIAHEIKPDVILTDLRMDGFNGFQLADRLSQSRATINIPVIAMTSCYTKDEHRQLMSILGIKTVLKKPFKVSDIICKIESVKRVQKN